MSSRTVFCLTVMIGGLVFWRLFANAAAQDWREALSWLAVVLFLTAIIAKNKDEAQAEEGGAQ